MIQSRNKMKRKAFQAREKIGGFWAKRALHKKVWLGSKRGKQKEQLKELHKQTFQAQKQDEVARGLIDAAPKWTSQCTVNRDLFVKTCLDFVNRSKVQYQTAKPGDERDQLVFLREKDGQEIPIFALPFFTDALSDENEEISWLQFKTNVFFQYMQDLETSIASVQREILVLTKVDRAFDELKAESKAGDNITYALLKKRLVEYSALPAEDAFWKLDCWTPEKESESVTREAFLKRYGGKKSQEQLERLKQQLEDENRSSVNPNSLSLTTVSSADDLDSALKGGQFVYEDEESDGETAAPLPTPTPPQPQEEKKSKKAGAGGKKNKGKVAAAAASDAVVATPQADSSPSATTTTTVLTAPSSHPGDPPVKPSTKADKEPAVLLELFPGFPQSLLSKYNSNLLPKLTRGITRKLYGVIRTKYSAKLDSDAPLSSMDVAKMLLQNALVLFSLEKEQLSIELEQEGSKHDLQLRTAKNDADRASADAEYDESVKSIRAELLAMRQEFQQIEVTLRDNYKNELKRLRQFHAVLLSSTSTSTPHSSAVAGAAAPSSGSDGSAGWLLMSNKAAQFLFSGIKQYYKTASLKVSELPLALDYSSELHEPLSQASDEYGFVCAAKLVKEYQEYKNIKLIERFSIDFLKATLNDYNPDAETRSLLDILNILKNVGIATESVFAEFKQRIDNKSAKTKARLMVHAASFTIDAYFKVLDLPHLKDGLYKYGPCFITMPIYNKSEQPWKATSLDAPIKGYHTMVIAGYDDTNARVLLRNSWGKSWATFGNCFMSYDDVFNARNQIVMTIDGDSHRAEPSVIINPLGTVAITATSNKSQAKAVRTKIEQLSQYLKEMGRKL